MPEPEARASTILEKLLDAGVTHIVGLPDNASAALLELARQDRALRVVSVTREGEAFAIASGLWIGGALPIVVTQNTGLLEAGDSLRGTASRMGIPLVILVTCRGWSAMQDAQSTLRSAAISRDVLVRSDLDSVAFMTERTLEAWGIPYQHYASDADATSFDSVWQLAATEERPAGLLITSTLV